MKTNFAGAACAFAFSLIVPTANAALIDRGGGLIYDTDLDITWLADANATNGLMNWSQANTWATDLTVDGVSGWRLPITLLSDPSCGIPGNPYGYNCTGSEMGHLFYNELGGVAGQSILTTHNDSLFLFQNFENFVSRPFWSGTALGYSHSYFAFNGNQDALLVNTDLLNALAIHPGDVAAVPIPAAAWLFSPGLLGLIGFAKKRKV